MANCFISSPCQKFVLFEKISSRQIELFLFYIILKLYMGCIVINNYQNYHSNISFGMLKKSKLTPFKRVFCETYHPPLEKMYKVEDLTKWVEKNYEILKKPNEFVGIEEALKPWKDGLENLDNARHRNSVYWKYLIYDSMKHLHTSYLPFFDMNMLIEAIASIKSDIKQGCEKFNFFKLYSNHIKEVALNKYFAKNSKRTGWIGFVGSNNIEKQEEAIKDIRALSIGTTWCTKGPLFSKLSIETENNGFYIYLKDGKTLYGVRTKNNLTEEIKNEHNISVDLPKDLYEQLLKTNPAIEIWQNNVSMLPMD